MHPCHINQTLGGRRVRKQVCNQVAGDSFSFKIPQFLKEHMTSHYLVLSTALRDNITASYKTRNRNGNETK